MASLPQQPKTVYNPNVLQAYADELYDKANSVIVNCTVAWGFIGGLSGYGVATVAHFDLLTCIGSTTAILGYLGYTIGEERAFKYKFEAQELLCQMQVEKNTRAILTALQQPEQQQTVGSK